MHCLCSKWCYRELALADDEGKLIVPLFHGGVYPPNKMRMRLSAVQSIPGGKPFNPDTEFDDVVEQLVTSIKGKGFTPQKGNQDQQVGFGIWFMIDPDGLSLDHYQRSLSPY